MLSLNLLLTIPPEPGFSSEAGGEILSRLRSHPKRYLKNVVIFSLQYLTSLG